MTPLQRSLDQPLVVSGHWKAVLVIFIVFAFGCFSGAVSMSMIAQHRTGDALLRGQNTVGKVLERRLLRDMELEGEQRQAAHALFADNSRQRERLENQIHPQTKLVDHETVTKIDALLQPEQRRQFHKNIAAVERHFGHACFDPGLAPGSSTSDEATESPDNP